MTCRAEQFIHFVMTAHDIIVKADLEIDKVTKLEMLNEAMNNLNLAERSGAPKETLKELRNLINNKFMEAVDE